MTDNRKSCLNIRLKHSVLGMRLTYTKYAMDLGLDLEADKLISIRLILGNWAQIFSENMGE